MESPWAYVVLALTFLIDSYLLYIFFMQKAASRQSHRTLLTPIAPSGPGNRIASDVTERPDGSLAQLNVLLGCAVAILAVAMLVFVIVPSIRLP